jgi:hypothetical protein
MTKNLDVDKFNHIEFAVATPNKSCSLSIKKTHFYAWHKKYSSAVQD